MTIDDIVIEQLLNDAGKEYIMAWENGHKIINEKHVIKKHRYDFIFICIYT